MRFTSSAIAALATAFMSAAPATASEVKIYPYATAVNYCPAGLQPVVLNGVICCGTPNVHQSYQQVMRHPVKRSVGYSPFCKPGEKGC